MSDEKLISPLLDNFAMGEPMSNHHGVRCCPAMQNDSDKKYIVKIISIPASQVQLEALLLTGAYNSEASALSYFKELADDIVEQTQTLNRLAKLEGFLPCEGSQIVPMVNAVGYNVYLLNPYRHSLERYMRRNAMTHLNAVNLGLDMCASMAVCRRAGYLYVDLKPSNIFISDDKEFRIGDLGFIPMASLKYASLPDKYRSAYTAPEMADPLNAITDTLDIYAIGMILYQVYNDGKLPAATADGEPLPAPAYADYEMAEIILKACDPDPEKRWRNPIEMGQALVSYMQHNGANDVPIVTIPATEDIPVPEAEEMAALDTDSVSNEEDAEQLTYMAPLDTDETLPSEDMASDIGYDELSNDTSDILAQADELIAHDTPEGVVAPEPIDVPIPAPIVAEETEAEAENTEAEELAEDTAQDSADQEEDPPVGAETMKILFSDDDHDNELEEEYDYYEEYPEESKGSAKKLVIGLIIALLIAGLAIGGYFFYTGYYLQTVSDMQLVGSENMLDVLITSDIDESVLTVVCTDTYGNKKTASVVGGKATFTDLNPNYLYNIKVEIQGLHKLTGDISDTYTTPAQTNIVSFDATTGTEDGSVILRFTVDGMNTENWKVTYSTEGEVEKSLLFTGHMVTVNGLTVGKTYTFTLDTDEKRYIVGNDTLEYTATALVFAENLTITGCADGELSAQWAVPAGQTVESWTVHCYNDAGYDQVITTAETTAKFTGLDSAAAYTVEVTAKGMTSGSRAYVTAGSVTAKNHKVKINSPTKMTVSWEFAGTAPEGGWLLLYTIDGSTTSHVARTKSTSVSISPIVPGATYYFTLQTESGATVFNSTFTGETPKAGTFDDYLVETKHMTVKMCEKPNKDNWQHDDVKNFTSTFKVGQKAAFTVRLSRNYNTSQNQIVTMYVIRDEQGKLVRFDTQSRTWTSMWRKYKCQLEVPSIPDTAGKYSIEIYFNGCFIHSQNFEVTA